MINNHMTRCSILLSGKCKSKQRWYTFSYIRPAKLKKVFMYGVDKNAEIRTFPMTEVWIITIFLGNCPGSVY